MRTVRQKSVWTKFFPLPLCYVVQPPMSFNVPISLAVLFVGTGCVYYLQNFLFDGITEDKRPRLVDEKAAGKAKSNHAEVVLQDYNLRRCELNRTVRQLQQSLITVSGANEWLMAKNLHLKAEVTELNKKIYEQQKDFHATRLEHVKGIFSLKSSHEQALREMESRLANSIASSQLSVRRRWRSLSSTANAATHEPGTDQSQS